MNKTEKFTFKDLVYIATTQTKEMKQIRLKALYKYRKTKTK